MCSVWSLIGWSLIESVFSQPPLKPNQSSLQSISKSVNLNMFFFLFCASSTHQNPSVSWQIFPFCCCFFSDTHIYTSQSGLHQLLPWQQPEATSLYYFFFPYVGPKGHLLVAMLPDEPVNMFMFNLEPHVHIHGEKSQRRRKYRNRSRTGESVAHLCQYQKI